MAKSEPKTFPHDESFPSNVNPTEENRKAWSDQLENRRKDEEKAAEKDEALPDHEALMGYGDPNLADGAEKPSTNQNKAVSK